MPADARAETAACSFAGLDSCHSAPGHGSLQGTCPFSVGLYSSSDCSGSPIYGWQAGGTYYACLLATGSEAAKGFQLKVVTGALARDEEGPY